MLELYITLKMFLQSSLVPVQIAGPSCFRLYVTPPAAAHHEKPPLSRWPPTALRRVRPKAALLHGAPRNASVYALGEVQLRSLSRERFEAFDLHRKLNLEVGRTEERRMEEDGRRRDGWKRMEGRWMRDGWRGDGGACARSLQRMGAGLGFLRRVLKKGSVIEYNSHVETGFYVRPLSL